MASSSALPPILGGTESSTLIVTGADATHFANLRVLVGSWLTHMRAHTLAVCDYGFTAEQVAELRAFPGIVVLSAPVPITHPWQGKSVVGRFIAQLTARWDVMIWIDADALFSAPLPSLPELMAGYDMIIDAHIQSVGEIVHDCNMAPLGLRKDDAYFSAGCWIARRGVLLDTYERFSALVQGQGNLWECDAFVAAIYREKLRLRTVNGGIWHSRGKTSLHTCVVRDGQPYHADHPVYILHANEGYTVRSPDHRRVFKRPELAAIQDRFEAVYLAAVAAR